MQVHELSPKWLRFISIHMTQIFIVTDTFINQQHVNVFCQIILNDILQRIAMNKQFTKDFLTLNCNTYFHYRKRPSQATTVFWHENMLLHNMAARATCMYSQWRARAAESLGQAHVQRLAPSENLKETTCHLVTTSFPKIWHPSGISGQAHPRTCT